MSFGDMLHCPSRLEMMREEREAETWPFSHSTISKQGEEDEGELFGASLQSTCYYGLQIELDWTCGMIFGSYPNNDRLD